MRLDQEEMLAAEMNTIQDSRRPPVKPRVVVALGRNALIRRGERADVDIQRRNVEQATEPLAALAEDYDLVITHGNGPQVGLLALQGEAYKAVSPYPLDVLGAETQGMIGYLLEQSLGNLLPQRAFATLLTQVIVDPQDPAFADPSKFVGPIYGKAEASELTNSRGWVVKRDGDAFRRVVASPEPMRIVEISTISRLVNDGVIVICSGGGGIPVVERQDILHGVEAVVDKDLSAALLASELDADALLLLTDVTGIQRGFGSKGATKIDHATPSVLRGLSLPAGSMGPKAEAACRFVGRTRRRAAIGALQDAVEIAQGLAGTQVTLDEASVTSGPRKTTTSHESLRG